MLIHAIAHRGYTDDTRESALKADCEKNPLLHLGTEPVSAVCLSDAVPSQLHLATTQWCIHTLVHRIIHWFTEPYTGSQNHTLVHRITYWFTESYTGSHNLTLVHRILHWFTEFCAIL